MQSDESDVSRLSHEYLSEIRNRPRHIVYSDSEGNYRRCPVNLTSWTDRRLKCVKYLDDCLAIKKVNFLGTGKVVADGRLSLIHI